MSRRSAVLSVLLVAVVATVVRIWAAREIVFPRPEDTAYYVGVARNLLEGRGLVSDAIWSFGTPPLVFPRPAFEVWLPLPTFLAAIPMAIAGPTFAAAQVSSIAMGTIVPIIAWGMAGGAGRQRGLGGERLTVLALGTGLTAAVYLPLVLHSALPDSTIPFAVLALLTLWLMARLVAGTIAREGRWLTVLGLLLGVAALARNDAVWLAVTWVAFVLAAPGDVRLKARRIGLVAVISILVFLPWAIRDQLAFGSPFPGQALSNALSLDGRDIFAWADPPTLARYLGAGIPTLLELRVTGILHNLSNVLLFLGIPISVLGLIGLPITIRIPVLRPLLVFSALTFLSTSLLFPVSTTWGTFLHAAGPVHVLLVISAMLLLDAGIARLAAWLGWQRPVAWLGPTLGVFASAAFTLVFIPTFGGASRMTEAAFASLGSVMAAAGHPIGPSSGPVITNVPIWLAETARTTTLALPDESPTDVLDLAKAFPGTKLLVVMGEGQGRWPAVLDAGTDAAAACFREIDLASAPAEDAVDTDRLDEVRAFEVVCP